MWYKKIWNLVIYEIQEYMRFKEKWDLSLIVNTYDI